MSEHDQIHPIELNFFPNQIISDFVYKREFAEDNPKVAILKTNHIRKRSRQNTNPRLAPFHGVSVYRTMAIRHAEVSMTFGTMGDITIDAPIQSVEMYDGEVVHISMN